MNPNEYGQELVLNISRDDNGLHFDLVKSVAGYFRLLPQRADEIINEVQKAVGGWREIAEEYSIGRAEQERMATAFE